MAVEDHGLEVLKKSGEEVIPGDKSDHYIKTGIAAAAGTTTHFNGTQDDTPVNVPVTAGNHISLISVSNLSEKKGEDLFVSFDAGVTFSTVFAGEAFEWEPKGVTQINFKSNLVAGVAYEIVMNRE